MAIHIDRKLIFESLDNSTSRTCSSYYCNLEVYHSIVCPLSCFYICLSICLLPELESPALPNFTPKVPPLAVSLFPFFILLISILGIAVNIFCAYNIHKFRNSRFSSQLEQEVVVDEEEEFSGTQSVGLQQSVISTIIICNYKRGEGLIDGTECSVCSSELKLFGFCQSITMLFHTLFELGDPSTLSISVSSKECVKCS